MLTESVSSLLRAQNTIYFDVFSACVLVYDYILTFNSEVSLIWGEPWKSLKILFLLSRYLPFVDTTLLFLYHSISSQSECSALYLGLCILFAIGLCITEYIFAVRTWAMWGFDRKVGMVLATAYLACWLPNVAVAVLLGRGAKFLPPAPAVHGCNEASANSTIILAQGGIDIVYWLILIGLMVAKGGSPWKSFFRDDLFSILYRDGLLYCFFPCALVILNMIAITWPHERVNLLFYFKRVMHSVLTNHLLFHIRRYGRKTVRWDLNVVTGGTRPPMGSLAFEHELETWVAGQPTRNTTDA